MYDITNIESTLHIDDWISVIRESSESFPILLIGGKSDLEIYREVKKEEGEALTKKYDFKGFWECSSRTGENVERAFEELTLNMLVFKKVSWSHK